MSFIDFLKKHFFRLIVILIMIGTLSYFFIHLARENQLAQAFIAFSNTKFSFLILSFVFMVSSLFIKAFRFFVLIQPSSENVTFRNFLIPFFVGYGFSTLGPLKSGEIASVEINKRSVSIPRSSSLAAIAFFRVFDMFLVLIFFLIAMGTTIPEIIVNISNSNPTQAATLETISQIIFYVAIVGTVLISIILFLPPVGKFGYRIIKLIITKFSEKGGKWLEKNILPALENYYESLKLLYKEKIVALIVVITTIARWVLEFYSLVFTIKAFSVDISFLGAASITSLTLLAGLVTPAGIGAGTITAQALLEGLGINPDITGATIIFQTLVGTGLTLTVAAITSVFLRDYKRDLIKEKKKLTGNNKEVGKKGIKVNQNGFSLQE